MRTIEHARGHLAGGHCRHAAFRSPVMALVTATLFVSLAGCASSVYEGLYAWDDGWRKAKLVRTGARDELGGRHSTDCRFASATNHSRYAVIEYRAMSRNRRAVVPVASETTVAPGDLVYANVTRCADVTLAKRG